MLKFRRFLLVLTAGFASASAAQAFTLRSAEIAPGATIALPQVHARCGGRDISPSLSWEGAPAGTRGYALIMFDPDARKGAGWWHWAVVDIPADVHALESGALLPANARALRNSFGEANYGGPCPPQGDAPHHYVFTLYALKSAHLALQRDADAQAAEPAIRAAAIASTTLTGRYGR